MPTNYPATLDTTTQQPNNKVDGSVTATVHASHHNNISDALIAIETELGTLPKGGYTNVATRLSNAIYLNQDTAQILQPTKDVASLIFRLNSNTSVAHFVRFEDALGNLLAYVSHSGTISAPNYLVNGVQISSANLADGPFAPLDSPAFTGTPTVPTPDPTDDSNQIPTTHWINNKNYVDTTTLTQILDEPDLSPYAKLDSPTFVGTPRAPTPAPGDISTKIATTAFAETLVDSKISSGSPLYTFASTVAGLGTPAAGKAGMLAIGPSPYDYMPVVYDTTYGKWIGPTIQASHKMDPIIGLAVLQGLSQQVNFPTVYPTQMTYLMSTPWRIWDTAGMKPQTRIIWNGAMTTLNTANLYVQLHYHGIDVGASPPTAIPIVEHFIVGTTPAHYDSGWLDLPGTPTIKDEVTLGWKSKVTLSGTANLLYVIGMIRWVSK